MKKLLLSALAIASVVACEKNEVVEQLPAAINFEQTYVKTSTRATDPSTTTKSINAFDVWAFVNQPSGIVLVDEDVTKDATTDKWTYRNVQYWMPGNEYYFGALAPMNSDNWALNTTNANTYGAGVLTFTNVNGSEDLLYAAAHVSTEGKKIGDNFESVKLTFNHLLSKIKFTFKNEFVTDNVTMKVSGITMSSPKTGTIDLAVENWWDNNDWKKGNESFDLAFGDVQTLSCGQVATCADERLTIPVTNFTHTVKFNIKLYLGDVEAYSVDITREIPGHTFQMGKAYNIQTVVTPEKLNLQAIDFEIIEVKEWDNV